MRVRERFLLICVCLLVLANAVLMTCIFYRNDVKEDSTKICLPPQIYALSGHELNIYFDNIINGRDSDYDFNVVCDIGKLYEGFYRVIPESGGVFPITIQVIDNCSVLCEATSEIVVTDGKEENLVINCLVIGDSIICNDYLLPSIDSNMREANMSIKFWGTRGESRYKHEGRGGWTINKYLNSEESPFVFEGEFDFYRYWNCEINDNMDYYFIHSGVNELFYDDNDEELKSTLQETINDYDRLITTINTVDPKAKICLMITIPPAYTQDEFGEKYGTKYPRWRYKANNYAWIETMINYFSEDERVFLVPVNVNLDTKNNMGTQRVRVNFRNEKTKIVTAAEGHVHPAESGYWQIADEIYYFIRCLEDGRLNGNKY